MNPQSRNFVVDAHHPYPGQRHPSFTHSRDPAADIIGMAIVRILAAIHYLMRAGDPTAYKFLLTWLAAIQGARRLDVNMRLFRLPDRDADADLQHAMWEMEAAFALVKQVDSDYGGVPGLDVEALKRTLVLVCNEIGWGAQNF